MSDIIEIEGHYRELARKIEEKTANICVVGLGQVGLPTALSFLKLGYKVIGLDINELLIQKLKAGKCPLPENGFSNLLTTFLQNRSLSLSSTPDVLSGADVIIICVPTPLEDNGHTADMIFMRTAIVSIAGYLKNLKLIIVESTIPPGSMKHFIIPLMEQLSARKAYSDFLISFCPERISPGKALQEFIENDRIVGSNDDNSYLLTFNLLKKLTKGKIYRTDTSTAEISKLAENSFRDVNIAFANELAIICEKSNTDVLDVIKLANTHPRVNIHLPGPGVGGPCLPKDPYLLIMGNDLEKSIVKTARWINDSMPSHIVDILVRAVNGNKTKKDKLNVLILGISYKPEVNDIRYSPTHGIVSSLKKEGFLNITIQDPLCDQLVGVRFSSDLKSVLCEADCVIIATAHSEYSYLTERNFKKGCIIIDAVRSLNKNNFYQNEVTYIALGS